MRDDENAPISAQDARELFAAFKTLPAIVLAVSGGPDSMALMWLMARWRRGLSNGPRLVAVTVDHGLRPEAASEARDVKRLAKALDLPHRTVRWTGDKPRTGVPAAARAARYRLLTEAARTFGATHILTAHTRDDQAETLLMRLLRGSGIAGLSAMARESVRNGVVLTRPLLDVPKSRLIATPHAAAPASIASADRRGRRRCARPGATGLKACACQRGGGGAGRWRGALSGARGRRGKGLWADGARLRRQGVCRHARGSPSALVTSRDQPVRT
jgi:tRNA(Ile)-lysidine synthase